MKPTWQAFEKEGKDIWARDHARGRRCREFGRETARDEEGSRGQSGRYLFPDI